jgi:hypothetical protein
LVMYKGESGGRIYAAGISFILSGLWVAFLHHNFRFVHGQSKYWYV